MVDFRLLTCALFLFTELAQAEAAPTEGATPAERILATFSLRDYLNRNWHKELVTFKVDPKLLGRKDVTLLDVDRQSVPFQWQTGSNAGIAFLASVPRFTRVEYRLMEGRWQRTEGGGRRAEDGGKGTAASPLDPLPQGRRGENPAASGITAKDEPESVELDNGNIAIRVNKGAKAMTQGPIAGIQLTSGKWVGAGELHWPTGADKRTGMSALRGDSGGAAASATCRVKIVAEGPVFAEVELDYAFPDKGEWRLRCRVLAGEPVVLIDEEFSGPPGAVYEFKLGAGWEPDHLFWRKERAGATTALKDWSGESVFLLEPWVEWWRSICGNWLAVYREGGPDMLAVGLREPACWVEPAKTKWYTKVDVAKAGLGMELQLRGFQRKWMLMSLPTDEGFKVSKDSPPVPQQYLIKYGDVPLDQIKDYVLEWHDDLLTLPLSSKGGEGNGAAASEPRDVNKEQAGLPHPRLYVTSAELKAFRSQFKVDSNYLTRLRQTVPRQDTLDDYIPYALASGDQELMRKLAQFAVAELQTCVDLYARQDVHPTQGFAPHQKYDQVIPTLNALDPILQPGILPPEERKRVRAQLAFLGYTLANPSVHSPERGYSATANMTTATRCMSGIIACLIPDHPEARAWAQLGIHEMAQELETWTGPHGGWLEAPHYATVSFDALIALALALRQTSFTDTDWAHHPKLKAAVRWLACISSPRDTRMGGQRHMPEIGKTYTGERTCLPGWLARIWKDKDPAFAKQMQWIWQEQGSFTHPGIGGLYPGLMGYSALMFDSAIPAEAPAWGSEWFPEAGAVLRAHFPGGYETYLHYIQGRLHQHYDYDEGSFILWGKGHPLCEDFGYYGRAAAADHSRLAYASDEELGSEGKVREFVAGERLDYLHGERPNWNRQILFVKDRDPLGPNYFVVRDTLKDAHATDWRRLLPINIGTGPDWRIWLATDTVPHSGAGVPPASSASVSPAPSTKSGSTPSISHLPSPISVSSAPLRIAGRFGVDLVVYFNDTSSGTLSTEELSRTSAASGFKNQVTTQHSLHLRLGQNDTVSAVLYPVTHTQTTPTFTKLANGRAVKIESSYGTDYAFLGLEPFDFKQGDLSFHGQAGAVQLRPDGAHLSLAGKGQLRYKDQVLTADH